MSIYGHTAIFVETPILHRLAPHVSFASQDPHEAVYLGFDWIGLREKKIQEAYNVVPPSYKLVYKPQ